jgi:phenylalanyl-tRNA synthetase beta chain
VADQARYLAGLGFISDRRVHPWEVHVPTWRRDVHGAADLVEEIVRLHGLDRCRASRCRACRAWPPRRDARAAHRAPRAADAGGARAGRGGDVELRERGRGAAFGRSGVAAGEPAERRTGGDAAQPAARAGDGGAAQRGAWSADVRLFEIGRRYLADGERPTAAVLLAGDASPRDWRTGKARAVDAYDAKAEAMALLAALGAPVERLAVQSPASGHYHPGRSARLVLGKVVLAEFGALHPRVLEAHDLGSAAAAVVFLDALPPRRKAARGAFAPAALQAVRRDFAFLYPAMPPPTRCCARWPARTRGW